MVRGHVHWIAGPTAYRTNDRGEYPDRTIGVCKWEFIGATPTGEIRRWHLCFSLETRKFTTNTLTVTDWDKQHANDLADLFRPIAILRSMLPKGSITVALKAMIGDQGIAEATLISLRGGKL